MERLLAGAAVAGAALYVLLNALYVEFYDDFGIRPEDVGVDRLTVLGRAAWVALVAVMLIGPVVALAAGLRLRRRVQQLDKKIERSASGTALSAREHDEGHALQYRVARYWFTVVAVVLLTIVFLVGYYAVRLEMERKAEDAAAGQEVSGLGWVVPFVDVRAGHARATWVGDLDRRPQVLDSAHLTYLGRGPRVVALLACGRTTVMLPADDVVVRLLDQGEEPSEQDQGLPDECIPSAAESVTEVQYLKVAPGTFKGDVLRQLGKRPADVQRLQREGILDPLQAQADCTYYFKQQARGDDDREQPPGDIGDLYRFCFDDEGTLTSKAEY